jgi:tRNA(adenine34) deaminase
MNYELFMAEAIAEARRGGEEGEVPVGAVAVLDDAMIARDHDRTLLQRDPTAHAVLLTAAGHARKLESRRLSDGDHLHHPRALRHVRRAR